MSCTHRKTVTYNTAGGNLTITRTQTADAEIVLSSDIPVALNQLTAFVLDYSQLKGFFMKASAAGLTVYTNAAGTGSPDQTFVLAADEAVQFLAGGSEVNPFTSDVTCLYISNAAAVAVHLDIRALVDPTV